MKKNLFITLAIIAIMSSNVAAFDTNKPMLNQEQYVFLVEYHNAKANMAITAAGVAATFYVSAQIANDQDSANDAADDLNAALDLAKSELDSASYYLDFVSLTVLATKMKDDIDQMESILDSLSDKVNKRLNQ